MVCVTYCVGGLKVANTTAGAYAEKSPVVVISGAPGMKEREKNPLLHHKVREFDTQKKVFEQLTVASTVLDDADAAFQEIDRVLNAALRYKRPVYIELPRDMVNVPGIAHHKPAELHAESDPDILREAVREAVEMIRAAKQPVMLVDVEVHRFGLQPTLLQLLDQTQIPFATTILGKSVIDEQHPLYLGVYEGAMGREAVRNYVESSDCLIMLGTFMTDINLGIYPASNPPAPSTPPAKNSPSAITISRKCASRISCAAWSAQISRRCKMPPFPGRKTTSRSSSNPATKSPSSASSSA